MAALHINEKVCARNCKKNTITQLTGRLLIGVTGEGLQERQANECLTPKH